MNYKLLQKRIEQHAVGEAGREEVYFYPPRPALSNPEMGPFLVGAPGPGSRAGQPSGCGSGPHSSSIFEWQNDDDISYIGYSCVWRRTA
jgi:hypothetical protein